MKGNSGKGPRKGYDWGYARKADQRGEGLIRRGRILFNPIVRIAFKEWAVVVDALGRGEQILILRKGGISEGRGGFRLEHQQFWLFPTLYHQQAENVIESARQRFEPLLPGLQASGNAAIQYWGRVVEAHRVVDLAAAHRLQGQHIWKEDVISQRFDWGPSQNIFAIAVRIYRLPASIPIPLLPEYGGCKSWVELQTDLPTDSGVPVLNDSMFNQSLQRFRHSLRETSSLPTT